jgi:hypothetical protein
MHDKRCCGSVHECCVNLIIWQAHFMFKCIWFSTHVNYWVKLEHKFKTSNNVLMCEHSRMMSHWKKFTGWGQIMECINPTSLIIKWLRTNQQLYGCRRIQNTECCELLKYTVAWNQV